MSIRRLAVPAYVLLCLLLGGSVRGLWQNALLQLLAIVLIVWAALTPRQEPPPRGVRSLMILVCLSLALGVVQLLPLPPALWTALPGREMLVRGFALQGMPLPWLSASLAPYATLSSALMLLPPVAVLVATLRLPQDEDWLIGAVIAGAVLNVFLGTVQITSGAGSLRWYLYEITNTGAVGFFANSNHMGTLLLAAISFSSALVAAGWARLRRRRKNPAAVFLGLPALIVIAVGLALNHSLAAIALAGAVVLASLLLFPAGWKARWLLLPAGAVAIIAGILVLTTSSITGRMQGQDSTSFQTRSEIWAETFDAVRQTFPAGTGFGTFDAVYPATEDPASVDRYFVNHAHNDYLELLLEGGLPALLLLVAFGAWWALAAVRAWVSPQAGTFAKAAAIASGAILAHSLVDYPLRTSAISALFALCLALLVATQVRSEDKATKLGQAKHVRIA